MDLLMFRVPGGNFFVMGDMEPALADHEVQDGNWFVKLRRKTHQVYDSLRQRFEYQENVCAALRHADSLHILHATSLTQAEVAERFREFLRARRAKHRKWFGIDLALALAGSLLTPIPGPNIFFFYPAARALSHYFAAQGADKARHIQVLTYAGEANIDRMEKSLHSLDEVRTEIEELERTYRVSRLRLLLERL